jgi:hypothetical protein
LYPFLEMWGGEDGGVAESLAIERVPGQHFSLAEKLAGREDASDINLNLSRNDESIVRLRPLSISVLEFVDRGRRLELLQVSLAWGI